MSVALDFNCSTRLVRALSELYGRRGYEFIHLETLVAGRTADEIWADSYKRSGGRAVISGDANIAYKPHQALAFIDCGLLSFFPSECWCNMPGHARNAVLIYAWPLIEAKIAEGGVGACWRIPCRFTRADRELRLGSEPLQRLRIPQAVLDGARSGGQSTR